MVLPSPHETVSEETKPIALQNVLRGDQYPRNLIINHHIVLCWSENPSPRNLDIARTGTGAGRQN